MLSSCESKKTENNLEHIHYEASVISSLLEGVIRENFLTEEGLVKTNLTNRKEEYLAESQGLLLQYFLAVNDEENFNQGFLALKQAFPLNSKILSWQIIAGEQAKTNALIDDFRVIKVLEAAQEKWSNKEQAVFLQQLIMANTKNTMLNGYFVDFGSEKKEQRANTLTLSYADPSAFKLMELSKQQLEKNVRVIEQAPQDENGYFAKGFDVEKESYYFEKNIHMVDQLLTAINKENNNQSTNTFHRLIKEKMETSNKLFGQYNRKKNKPSVSYESPAVYSYAILYSQLAKDEELEKRLNTQLQQLKNTNEASPYSGAFIEDGSESTHSFDNLLPLIVEGNGG